jgi:hypothetical protein
MKEKVYATYCENCDNSDSCVILNSYNCKDFVLSVDSNFKYVLYPELLQIEKKSMITIG